MTSRRCTVSLDDTGTCLAGASGAPRDRTAADAAGIGDAGVAVSAAARSCSSSARSWNSTAPPSNSSAQAQDLLWSQRLSDGARHDQLDLADRHRDRAADRLSDRLLPDDGDRPRRQHGGVCRSCCRISPASSCAPIPGWCCWASTGWSTTCCWRPGLIDAPLPLMYNRLGVLIGMTYVLLPYMVLTLYAAMRAIDPSCCGPRAAWAPAASTRSAACIFRSACTA